MQNKKPIQYVSSETDDEEEDNPPKQIINHDVKFEFCKTLNAFVNFDSSEVADEAKCVIIHALSNAQDNLDEQLIISHFYDDMCSFKICVNDIVKEARKRKELKNIFTTLDEEESDDEENNSTLKTEDIKGITESEEEPLKIDESIDIFSKLQDADEEEMSVKNMKTIKKQIKKTKK